MACGSEPATHPEIENEVTKIKIEPMQPWRAFWPLKEAAAPSLMGPNETEGMKCSPDLTAKYWYTLERGGGGSGLKIEEQRKQLELVMKEKYGDQPWYKTDDEEFYKDPTGQIRQFGLCPTCGMRRCADDFSGGSTFEGG